MSLPELVVLALATWRVAALLSYERGPGDIFTNLRRKLGIQPDDDGEPETWPDRWPANAVVCVWCLSVYVGTAWALLAIFCLPLAFWLALPFALSAVASMADKFTHG